MRGENWINETLVISHSNCWPGKCDSKEGQLVAALRPSLFFCELLQIWLCDPDHHSVYNLTNALVLSFSLLVDLDLSELCIHSLPTTTSEAIQTAKCFIDRRRV